ncbi:MAG: FHA domain-containing protein, partial [Actinomycetaceae bacterium]|nr:FHA domain-containing protein [Actinomycetaceae bacterium]
MTRSLAEEAADPRTTPQRMRELIQTDRSLYAAVDCNPNVDEPLRQWLWVNGGRDVQEAMVKQYEDAVRAQKEAKGKKDTSAKKTSSVKKEPTAKKETPAKEASTKKDKGAQKASVEPTATKSTKTTKTSSDKVEVATPEVQETKAQKTEAKETTGQPEKPASQAKPKPEKPAVATPAPQPKETTSSHQISGTTNTASDQLAAERAHVERMIAEHEAARQKTADVPRPEPKSEPKPEVKPEQKPAKKAKFVLPDSAEYTEEDRIVREEAMRLEFARAEKARLEAERKETELLASERVEAEQLAKEEAMRLEFARAETARLRAEAAALAEEQRRLAEQRSAAAELASIQAEAHAFAVQSTPANEVASDDADESTVIVNRSTRPRTRLVTSGGQTFELTNDVVILGRKPRGFLPGSVQLLNVRDTERTISKTHARLSWHDDGWYLSDLGSTNGVSVGMGHSKIELTGSEEVQVTDAFALGLH